MPLEGESQEHFVTLFDSRFLLLGLTLNESLQGVEPNSHLWVICMDELVEHQINKLSLKNVSTIPLRALETDELRRVKKLRTVGEYCWTLTPFAPQAVMDLAPMAKRVTYLDSDLFFFSNPQSIFQEFDSSQKHVLITEHAYAPNLDRTEQSGRFCVQFMVFRRTQESRRVMKWWQERCIEWCYDRIEDGKFGDQKYLDQWPKLFPDEIHVLSQVDMTLAPWNADFFLSHRPVDHTPIFYHFQSFRIVSQKMARLYVGVNLSEKTQRFYKTYLTAIQDQIRFMQAHGIAVTKMPEPKRRFGWLRKLCMRLLNRVQYAELNV
jgi:Nucleotide-diphospho-sugar transferase